MPAHAPVALVSNDQRLAADVRRLCAVAGLELQIVAAGPDVVRSWRQAAVVIVDAELAAFIDPVTGGGRREHVVLVAPDVDRLDVWRNATRLGAEQVFTLPADDGRLVDHLTLAAMPAGVCGPVLGVMPGSGGAGASTLAVAVAAAAARRPAGATLVDADPLAGGLDLLLGAEHIRGARWTELADVRGLVDPGALAESLPAVNGLRLLSGDRGGTEPPVEAMAALLAALRGLGSPVVVDLPHRPGAAAERAAGMCTGVVVVVLGEVRAAAAAARVAASAARCCDDVRVVVRVGPRSRLRPAEVSAAVGLPLLGVLQSDPAVAAAADRGDLARGAAGGLAGVAGDVIGWLDALVAAS